MKVEKIMGATGVNILDMSWKEYLILKSLLNNTGEERDNRIRAMEQIWGKFMTLEEALELVCEVEDRIWHPSS